MGLVKTRRLAYPPLAGADDLFFSSTWALSLLCLGLDRHRNGFVALLPR